MAQLREHFLGMGEAMQRSSIILALLISATVSAVAPAAADDAEDCNVKSGDPAIEACNRAINSGRYSGRALADAYLSRGQEWYLKKDYDKAISDATTAIEKKTDYLYFAYANRGNAKRRKGLFAEAIADYTKAIELDRAFTAAYAARGISYESVGEKDKAISDFRKVLSLPQKYSDGEWAQTTAKERLQALGLGN